MLRAHEPNEPIGVWTSLEQDDRGLKATGQLVLATVKGRETYELLRAGALDGLSIGYKAIQDKIDRKTGTRLLEAVDLFEISIVTFPMLPAATITRVKSDMGSRSLIEAINRATMALH